MLRMRPHKYTDASAILSWCKDEMSFCKGTAGVLGEYPISEKRI